MRLKVCLGVTPIDLPIDLVGQVVGHGHVAGSGCSYSSERTQRSYLGRFPIRDPTPELLELELGVPENTFSLKRLSSTLFTL
jgi:hypothetical protein